MMMMMMMFFNCCSVPSSPRNIHVSSRNGTAVTIKWTAPEWENGKLLGYQLYILYKGEKTAVNITGGHTNTYQIAGLSELLSFRYIQLHYSSWCVDPCWLREWLLLHAIILFRTTSVCRLMQLLTSDAKVFTASYRSGISPVKFWNKSRLV